MTKEKKSKGKTFYICEECSFAYKDKGLAQKCQKWCSGHNSCNIEITKHAVRI